MTGAWPLGPGGSEDVRGLVLQCGAGNRVADSEQNRGIICTLWLCQNSYWKITIF